MAHFDAGDNNVTKNRDVVSENLNLGLVGYAGVNPESVLSFPRCPEIFPLFAGLEYFGVSVEDEARIVMEKAEVGLGVVRAKCLY